MTWFWFNHFNVHQYKANIRAMLADYEEHAIRPHALGRFRDLLAATLRHPAMLRYLDNADNAAGRINENYAREIMELHTMGVGSGYSQHDVEELARCLTGLGIDARPDNPRLKPELQAQLVRDGLFEFNPARHDYGDKVFLGHSIKGQGLAEIDEVLDILARHPGDGAAHRAATGGVLPRRQSTQGAGGADGAILPAIRRRYCHGAADAVPRTRLCRRFGQQIQDLSATCSRRCGWPMATRLSSIPHPSRTG